MLEIDYPYDDFVQQFEALQIVPGRQYVTRQTGEFFLGDDHGFVASMLRVQGYFRQIYPQDEATEKAALFCMIVSFLANHMDEFDTAGLAVKSETEQRAALVSERLLHAVHFAFTNLTDDEWRGRGPTVTQVIELADTLPPPRRG